MWYNKDTIRGTDNLKKNKEKERNKMLDLLNSIPENIGWILVGVFSTLAIVVGIADIKIFHEVWKDYKEDREEGENFFTYLRNNY